MQLCDAVLWDSEKVIYRLRELYMKNGFLPFRMSKFEEYDLYAKNKDFLVSDNVITFNDRNGRLMALKPDVTLSIIKNSPDDASAVRKVFYNESVYRAAKGSETYGEIRQTGIEVFGDVGTEELKETLGLAVRSLETFSDAYVIAVSNLDILKEIFGKLPLTASSEHALYEAVSTRNPEEIENICASFERAETAVLLKDLLSLKGDLSGEIRELKTILSNAGLSERETFFEILESFGNDRVMLDFSVTSDLNYYNGIVFKGFMEGLPDAVLSGGQYDNLMKRMGRKSKAIGFAVYTDALSGKQKEPGEIETEEAFVNIALPKGRLGENVYRMFEKAGYECKKLLDPGRQLIFENAEKRVRYFWVKPSDVAIYVERGAADIGVCGKDIILEYEPEVYELLDLRKGKCRMAVAAPADFTENTEKPLRVATKFSNIAGNFYRSRGRDIELIHLNGSIEIAPILGLSDVIVDIVETGSTLKENHLMVYDTVVPISARLIANKSSYKFKNPEISAIEAGLREAVEDEK